MTGKDEEGQTVSIDHTTLLTLFGSNEKAAELFGQYEAGQISKEELIEQFPSLKPQLKQYGIEYHEDSGNCYTNTKPVPENWDSAMFFYTDEDGNTAATIRIADHGDDHVVTKGESIKSPAQQAAPDLVKLINREHDNVMQTVLYLHDMMKQMEEEEATANASATEPATPLEEAAVEGVDDEFTRARLLKEFRNKKGKATKH